MILMMFLSFQMQRFVFRCHSQHDELWTPCDLNSCLDKPEFVIRSRRTSDASKMLPSSVMSHHSQCNLSFHGWTCSPWILLVDRRQEKSRQLSMFYSTHSKLVRHNDDTHDVLVIPNAPFCVFMLLMMFLSFQKQRFVFRCYSWCSRDSKCNVLSFAVIHSMLSYERLATWTRVWTCQSLWSGWEEQVTQGRCYRHPTWAITRNAIWASMVGLAHHGSWSLIGSKRSPDSSRCSSQHIPNW